MLPWKYEAGTPNIADVIAFRRRDRLSDRRSAWTAFAQHEIELADATPWRSLGEVPGVTIYGPNASERGGVVAFTVDGRPPARPRPDRGLRRHRDPSRPSLLPGAGERVGDPGTARASFYVYNTPEEVDALVAAVEAARDIFSTEVSSIVAR